MSLRADLLCELLRRFARPPDDNASPEPPAAVRERLEALTRRAPSPPPFVRIEPVHTDGVPAEWVSVPASLPERVVLYLHGGSYISGSPRTHRNLTWRVARAARARVLAIDYHLAPEHPYPAAVEDVLHAQRWLLQEKGTRIAWCGDSAGGGLMFSAVRAATSAGVPLPCALVAFSPWTDLTCEGQSLRENEQHEALLTAGRLKRASAYYRGSLAADDPGPSTAHAGFYEAPPALIQVSESEMLRDDAYAIAARLFAAGGEVQLQVWKGLPHVWHILAPLLPESQAALREAGHFFDRWLTSGR